MTTTLGRKLISSRRNIYPNDDTSIQISADRKLLSILGNNSKSISKKKKKSIDKRNTLTMLRPKFNILACVKSKIALSPNISF